MLGKIQAEGISRGAASEIQLDDAEEDPCFCGRSCSGKQAPIVRQEREKNPKTNQTKTLVFFSA